MFDTIIRNGRVVDGTGKPAFTGDVAIQDGRIAAVGDLKDAQGRQVLDAAGKIVTPGFVDIHTHYDGQVTWDDTVDPSFSHGVTTIVMGNCGVGFAPVRKGQEGKLIELMEGVEDIPGSALAEGIRWDWETFPEYLDALERMPRALDIGTQVPHAAVRAYVMGSRAQEAATADDLAAMQRILRDALLAGALGFSTGRTTTLPALTSMQRTHWPPSTIMPSVMTSMRRPSKSATPAGRNGASVLPMRPRSFSSSM